MPEHGFYQEDSPWVEMKGLNWNRLTDGYTSKVFFKGHIFYNQQEYCENIFIIRRGRVAMCLCTPEGGMRVAMILDQGAMFGNQTIFDSNPNSCQAEVVSDTAEVFVLPKEVVKTKLRVDYEIVHNMLVQSNRINRMLLTQIELMSFQRSESRVCFFLLHMADQYSMDQNDQRFLQIRFTHQDIADVTGLSRVCVSNIISKLSRENILTKKSGTYFVVQLDRLRKKIAGQGLID